MWTSEAITLSALLDWSTMSLRESDCATHQTQLQAALQLFFPPKEWSIAKHPNGFGPTKYGSPRIDQPYVDGVSITHGTPRQHVWTLAATHDADFDPGLTGEHTACLCIHSSHTLVSSPAMLAIATTVKLVLTHDQRHHYFDDPFWDGEGCEGENGCCDRGGPWFSKQLPQPTQDDIELRLCGKGRLEDKVVLEQSVNTNWIQKHVLRHTCRYHSYHTLLRILSHLH